VGFKVNQIVFKKISRLECIEVMYISKGLIGDDMIIKPDGIALDNCPIEP